MAAELVETKSSSSRLGIFPEVSKFEHSSLTESEIESFYKLPSEHLVPDNRPYIWSNSVASIDGVTSFPTDSSKKSEALHSSPLIALSGVSPDAYSDWTLLNAGWAYADAVLSSGEILRQEPTTTYVPYREMMDFRHNILKKEGQPVNVIITASGNVSDTHPIISSSTIQTLLFTSVNGWENITKKWTFIQQNSPEHQQFEGYISYNFKDINTTVIVFEHTMNAGHLNFHQIFQILRQQYNVKYLDVTAGSVILGKLIEEKLLDEYRLTQSGVFLGQSLGRSGMPKFHLPFDMPLCPLLRFEGVRLGANLHHIFLRSTVDYDRLPS